MTTPVDERIRMLGMSLQRKRDEISALRSEVRTLEVAIRNLTPRPPRKGRPHAEKYTRAGTDTHAELTCSVCHEKFLHPRSRGRYPAKCPKHPG